MNTVFKVALGILLAFAIIFMAWFLIINYTLGKMGESFEKTARQQTERIQQQQQARINEQARQRYLAEQELERQRQLAERELAIKLDLAAQAQRKKDAWYAWYRTQEPDGCKNWTSEKHMVECTNHRIRKKREFGALWNSGKIGS